MGTKQVFSAVAVVVGIAVFAAPSAAAAKGHPHGPVVKELASFAAPGCEGGCGSGSTIGPDGALYVTDGKAGRVLRVDPRSGAMTTFAAGLPTSNTPPGIGGAMDIAFIGRTAYVLVTVVGPDFGQPDAVAGIYRIGRNGAGSPIADIGTWSVENPPDAEIFVPIGVQYALEPYQGGFAVTDGHHNRVLRVARNGTVSELIAFGNIVPTGLAALGPALFIGQAGPVPHRPADGKVLVRTPWSSGVRVVASGAPLIVDVELGPGPGLYALSQGSWTPPGDPGSPADPNTGSLRRVGHRGTLTPVAGPLDRPTSVAFTRDTAYVVTLTGKVLKVDNVAPRHWHGPH